MAVQALFVRTCNFVSNSIGSLNIRPSHVNLLPSVRGLKHETLERLKLLRIPEKPKKPLTPYFKFIKDYRDKILKENPNIKQTEIITKCAEVWNSLDNAHKEKYVTGYKEAHDTYDQEILAFNAKLTPEQKEIIEDVYNEKKTDRKKRKMNKFNRESDKPKRPPGSYSMYVMEQSKIRNESVRDLIRTLKTDWANLPEAEKDKYKIRYLKDREKYEEALAKWEAKMISEGKPEVVRAKTMVKPQTSRIKELKKDNLE